MSKRTEALKLALEALEESLGYVQEEAENAQRLYGQYPARQARIQGLKDDARKHMDAITAIREALAEQCVCGEPDTLGTHRTDGPCLAEQPACEHEWLRGGCFKCGQSIEQPAQKQYQSTADKCELTPVPAKGGLLPAQQDNPHPEYCKGYAAGLEAGAISEKKSAQQQEPVVWMYVNKSTHETKFQKHMRDFVDHSLWSEVPLYGEPLANHELQCVCGAVWLGDEMVHLPNKHPPASKPWVGLTDNEIALVNADYPHPQGFARAIEAKLREKNA